MQQSELQNSIHVVAILGFMFAMYALISGLQDKITDAISSGNHTRVWIMNTAMRLLYFVMSFLGGLFVRIISDRVIRGPRVGPFLLADLAWPFCLLVLIVCFFSYEKLVSEQSQLVVRAIRAEHSRLAPEAGK